MDFYKKLKFQHSKPVSTAILQINADTGDFKSNSE